MRHYRAALGALLAVSALAGCGDTKAPPKAAAVNDAPRASAPAAREVAIVIDKKKRVAKTTGTTVAQVLAEAGVKLGRYDLVDPAADQPAERTIKITRLLSKPKTKIVKTTLPVVKKKDAKLPPFTQKVLRKAKPGVTVVKTAFARRGKKKVEIVLARKVKSKPVAQILAVGPQAASSGSVAGLNWAGLAKCESGGNPRSVNPAGYYGLYQFSLSSWASVGGSGKPSDAPAAEQTYRAQLLYKRVGGRWQGQWPNCGRYLFS
ncbi:Resuscitation-promoting factor Rpf precursor [Actinomadura rubteroloni]|uniref:Resuscitation-promoting factor Rpf n=1 Tax=Actinomadura rubteroloni TaxID=1926885 RepID=A0A2P4UPY4_9ACTN|nr:resuscitation-promoting factor [Actinomadura rubteroloni]POM27102.1 Resuscitation-promoting factor Rpf precursor [Actinomadura rubteroloni]